MYNHQVAGLRINFARRFPLKKPNRRHNKTQFCRLENLRNKQRISVGFVSESKKKASSIWCSFFSRQEVKGKQKISHSGKKGKLREAKFARENIMQLFNYVCHFFFAFSDLHF
jgi:hypothetical protein